MQTNKPGIAWQSLDERLKAYMYVFCIKGVQEYTCGCILLYFVDLPVLQQVVVVKGKALMLAMKKFGESE